MSQISFETMTCSRCGGTGKYSWCEQYRDVCFKCHGSGQVFTKRGAAAFHVFSESMRVEVSSLKVGDIIHCEATFPNCTKRWFAPIVEITEPRVMGWSGLERKEWIGVDVVTEHPIHGGYSLGTPLTSKVRKGWSAEAKEAKRAEALAFQATLTKQGQPRKKGEAQLARAA